MKYAAKRSARVRHIVKPNGEVVPKDNATHERFLAVHRSTKGGAWVVSECGHDVRAFTIPKALLDVGEAFDGFGFDRVVALTPGARPERALVPICWCSGPGFVFDEKGLR